MVMNGKEKRAILLLVLQISASVIEAYRILSCQMYPFNSIPFINMIVEHAIILYLLDPVILRPIEFYQLGSRRDYTQLTFASHRKSKFT